MSANRAFFLFGVAALLPWNCLLSSMGFLDQTMFKGMGWTLTLTPLYQVSALVTQLCLLCFGHKLPTKVMLSISFPLGLLGALALLFFCSLNAREMMNNTTRFYCTLLTCLGLSVVANGMLQSSAGMLATMLMPEHGSLPAMYSNGLAVAGVLSFVVSLVVTAAAGQGYAIDALFVMLALTFVACSFDFMNILRKGLVRDNRKSSLDAEVLRLHMGEDAIEVNGTGTSARNLATGAASPRTPSRVSRAISRGSSIGYTVRREWKQQANLFLNYAQTFLVFPVVSSKWRCQDDWLSSENYTLVIVSVFQLADLSGRLLCSIQSFVDRCPSGDHLWRLVALRTLLLPLFFLCWREPAGLEWLFGNIGLHVGLMALFAVSNGALTTLAFLRGSASIQAEDSDVVGRALPLSLSTGIVVGSACSSCAVMWLTAS